MLTPTMIVALISVLGILLALCYHAGLFTKDD